MDQELFEIRSALAAIAPAKSSAITQARARGRSRTGRPLNDVSGIPAATALSTEHKSRINSNVAKSDSHAPATRSKPEPQCQIKKDHGSLM